MRICKKLIEHITITGEEYERNEAFSYCNENGYHITVSVPEIVKLRVISNRFKIVAEREVDQ